MAGKGKDIVALLDIGTARVSVALARLGPARSFEVLAWDESPSLGVRKGIITDTYSVARIIDNLLDNIREKVRINTFSAYVVFSGTSIRVSDYCSRISLGSNRRVMSTDVSVLIDNAGRHAIPEGLTPLHMLPLQYRLDGRAVSLPEGKAGQKLEADIRIVMAGQECIQAIHDAIRSSGMRVRKVVFSPVVEAPLLMNGAELQLGCVLVNLGAGTTTVSAFKYGNLLNATVLPVGMEHVKGDLAVGLRTTMSSAGELLRSISLNDMGDKLETIELAGDNNGESSQYEKSLVFSIIVARLEEICELIKQSIHSMNLTGFIPGGVKLTGGGSMLPGIAELFSRGLELDVGQVLPYISVSGEDRFRLSLAGLLTYCCRNEIGDGFDNILERLQSFVSVGNSFLRRRGGQG